jgi:hypothetical protein
MIVHTWAKRQVGAITKPAICWMHSRRFMVRFMVLCRHFIAAQTIFIIHGSLHI